MKYHKRLGYYFKWTPTEVTNKRIDAKSLEPIDIKEASKRADKKTRWYPEEFE